LPLAAAGITLVVCGAVLARGRSRRASS
jgi:hypothetical protein